MATNVTYLGAIKPVGSKILLNYNLGYDGDVPRTWAASSVVQFNFELDQNYIVTGLEMTKTAAAISDTNVLEVKVYRTDYAGNTLAIAAAALVGATGTDGLKGQKQIAGVPNGTVAVGVAAGDTQIFALGSYSDPEVAVVANKKNVGNIPTQQFITVEISGVVNAAALNPSCFIEVQLANFNEQSQGGAIQLGEVLTPSKFTIA